MSLDLALFEFLKSVGRSYNLRLRPVNDVCKVLTLNKTQNWQGLCRALRRWTLIRAIKTIQTRQRQTDVYGDGGVREGKLRQKHISATCALAIGTMMLGLALKAHAVPLDAVGSISFSGGSVSTALHGDLSGNVLTLNGSPPLSQLSIDTAGLWPSVPSPPVVQKILSCPGISNCVTVTTTPNLGSISLTVPTWNFDVGGTIDFNTAVAAITATPTAQMIIAVANKAGVPSFVVTPNSSLGPIDFAAAQTFAATLQAALNQTGKQVSFQRKGEWDKTTLSSSKTGAITKDGSQVQIDFDFEPNLLKGTFDDVFDFTFNSSVADLIGSAFESDLEATYDALASATLKSVLASALDIVTGGYSQACSAVQASGTAPIDLSCAITARFSLSGTVALASVPEPETLALFGIGIAGLGLARRRKAM